MTEVEADKINMSQIVELAHLRLPPSSKVQPDRGYRWVCYCQLCLLVRRQAREAEFVLRFRA